MGVLEWFLKDCECISCCYVLKLWILTRYNMLLKVKMVLYKGKNGCPRWESNPGPLDRGAPSVKLH